MGKMKPHEKMRVCNGEVFTRNDFVTGDVDL